MGTDRTDHHPVRGQDQAYLEPPTLEEVLDEIAEKMDPRDMIGWLT